jgi:hypothetical protein
LWGLKKGDKESSRLSRTERERLRQLERERLPRGFAGQAMKWGGHGWRVFKLYRRVRPFLPF